ncbi:MAG: HU family DNA-binding protein [Trichodesmium sp. MAG_R02]|jgi:nucleoid DNA-binding protein|nr:HU family DNA-binding protein [Trichodesmium sp. MAG_R02]
MEKYNKTKLISSVYETLQKEGELNLTKGETERVINEFIKQIKTAIISGEQVLISGFCRFFHKIYKGREYANPLTGDSITVASRNRPSVKFLQGFVETVSEANPIKEKSTIPIEKVA